MSTTRTYTLRQKQITRTNCELVPMPGVVVHIGPDGCVRGVSAEIAERMLMGNAWEIVGGGSDALRFEHAAKAWNAAREAERKTRAEAKAAARTAYISGTPLLQIMGHVAPAGERNADDWRWLIENDDGTLPEVVGEPEPDLPAVVAKPRQSVAPKVDPTAHMVKWDDSTARQAGESEADRRAREFGGYYLGEQPKAKKAAPNTPQDPNGLGVTEGARRGVQLGDDDEAPAESAPVDAPSEPQKAAAPEAQADAPAEPSVDVGARLGGMSARAVADVARTLGADLPKRGVGEAAREFLAEQPADKVIAVLDARAKE